MVKHRVPNIVRGGVALPLDKTNYYLVRGRKHEQGGIDIGKNPRTGLEVEDGEVVHVGDKELRVFSAEPILGGVSPSQLVVRGVNPDKVFAAQERFKQINGIKDDGTKAPFGTLKKLIFGADFNDIKTSDGRNYNPDYIERAYSSLKKSGLTKQQQAVVLANIIEESGGDPFALNKNSGKDYGLLQWVDRYPKSKETDPYKEIDNQMGYFLNTVNNLDDQVSWTHGGRGSGYQSFKDAYNDFNSEDIETINKGFVLGHVRPAGKHASAKNRLGVAEQIYDRIKRLGGESDEKDKNINKVSKNYIYKHFPYVAERLEFPLYTSRERKIVQDNPNKSIEVSSNVQGRLQMGEDIVKRINNFDKNDSLVYHPLLTRLNKYLERTYNKDNYTDNELDNINTSVAMLRSLSERKTRPYNENHKFVNETLEKLTDDEIDKILNVNYFGKGASLIEGLKAKPKGISIKNMWKLKNIMDKEYFHYDDVKKRFGGNMKHKLVEVNIGGNSKLIRVTKLSSTGESERSEGLTRKRAAIGIKTRKLEDGTVVPIYENILAENSTLENPIINPKFKRQEKATNRIESIKGFVNPNSNLISDVIGVGSNIIGSLITKRINNKALDSLTFQKAPVALMPAKLKTKININPQLDKMRESLADYERLISGNTASSRVALGRINRVRNQGIANTNELHGQKENIETQLINQDAINQQRVLDRNLQQDYQYRAAKNAFENEVRNLKAENKVANVQNIVTGIQDLLTRREQRKMFNKTLTAETLANPNLPAEMYLKDGIWSKELYDMYRSQYPRKA